MGHGSLATTTLLVGLAATALLVLLAPLLPGNAGGPLPIVTALATHAYAKFDQPLFDAHLKKGGQRESSWKAAGIGLMAGVVFLMCVGFVVVMYP
jgi:hypothetical protein